MNMFKSNGGFTLVELIVVIAILAILAGVAVPVYSGYIKSANKTADNQRIEAVNTAIAAAVAMEGLQVSDADTYLTATCTDGKLTVIANNGYSGVNKVWSNFQQFYGSDKCELTLDYFKNIGTFDGEVIGVDPDAPADTTPSTP